MIDYLIILSMMIVYSAFSHPWPPTVGVSELTVGLFIIILFLRIYGTLRLNDGVSSRLLRLTLHYCLVSALFASISSVLLFNQPGFAQDYIRDLVPHFFLLLLPITFCVIVRLPRLPSHTILFLISLLILLPGLIISSRAILESGVDFRALGTSNFWEGLSFRQYDPSVTFSISAAPLFLIISLKKTITTSSVYAKFSYILICALALSVLYTSFASLAAISQRAPIAMSLVILFSYLVIRSFSGRVPFELLPLIGVLILTVFFIDLNPLISIFQNVFNALMQKQEMAGTDAKILEFFLVLREVLNNPFGLGFGSILNNSVVGYSTSYTHNVFSYCLLKSGFVGLVLAIWYIKKVTVLAFHPYKMSVSLLVKHPWALASLLPLVSLIISVNLQPSYKPLSAAVVFGCIIAVPNIVLSRVFYDGIIHE